MAKRKAGSGGSRRGTREREKRRLVDSTAVKRQREAFFVLFSGISFTMNFRFSLGRKRSYDSDYDSHSESDSVASENHSASSVAFRAASFQLDFHPKSLLSLSTILLQVSCPVLYRCPRLFRRQKRCLKSVAEIRDVFCMIPTGSKVGESLIFQIIRRVLS